MSDLPVSLAEIRRRSARGVMALALRGGVGKAISLVTMILLSRLLPPADFGAFAILQLPLGWLNLIADAGISGAMIQREALSEIEARTGFTLRLLGALVLGGVGVLLAEPVGALYSLDRQAVQALRVLAVGPLISALGTVPSVRLHRRLRFERLALAELGSLIVGQGTAAGLALSGAGLWSLVGGSFMTVTSGTLLVNLLAPWRPTLRLRGPLIRQLLSFGLPYQGQGLVHLAKDQVIPALGGLAYSETQVGYLIWAVDLARWPRLPADYVARVAFPAFSRLQRDPAGLSRLLQPALMLVCLASFSAAAVGIVLGPRLVPLVFGQTWLPAVPALIVFLAQTPLDALAAVLLPLIYASGRAWRGLRLSLTWAALTWLFALVVVWRWDDWRLLPLAIALATAMAVLLIVRRLPTGVAVRWRRVVAAPLGAAAIVAGLSRLVAIWWTG
ncbi:MAG: oligosaccharide flippase family protein [Candidatus Promineifilaceae bacterium]|nr:oligosaccharide flippase family protein [Candidatus Promineifilaceae bacterium]